MRTFKNIDTIQKHISTLKKQGLTIGFVPTMGGLHEGHLSLMRQARKECDVSVISIFVNPTQFGPNEDYKKYPRNFRRDEKLARDAGVDAIFCPSAKSMYPNGFKTSLYVSNLSEVMCGASRPGHFEGVTTVVAKLFNIIQPDIAYFGQKDAQQAVIIRKMAADLNIPLKIKALPIIRERGGLAMSSRNAYLSKQERKDATILYKSLKNAERFIVKGERNSGKIIKIMYNMVYSKKNAVVDYISIVNSRNLKEEKRIKKGALIALAVWIGKIRLIDNITIT